MQQDKKNSKRNWYWGMYIRNMLLFRFRTPSDRICLVSEYASNENLYNFVEATSNDESALWRFFGHIVCYNVASKILMILNSVEYIKNLLFDYLDE